MSAPLAPGAAIGILGGGQLGRMLAWPARRMGYRVVIFSDEPHGPAAQWADQTVVGRFHELDKVAEFAKQVAVATFETEHVPLPCVDEVLKHTRVRPSRCVLEVAQNRQLEKETLARLGAPLPRFETIDPSRGLAEQVAVFGLPCVLKTTTGGYDGKGQWLLRELADVAKATAELRGRYAVLEEWIDLELECSVIGCRSESGESVFYGPVINHHRHHILDISLCPAEGLASPIQEQARDVTRMLMDQMQVVGLLCVEFFVTREGRLLVNELAPRPHNSGHLTIEGHVTSQYEQHIRAICGLPLGSVEQLRPAAMSNLLGDLWTEGEPNWNAVAAVPTAKLHLYGKHEAKPGRKMGHITATGTSSIAAGVAVRDAREKLTS
ncbi:MAG: 5-(carboxyamino)imidazole ribonucleotide synthase [Planctomycetota bacterium]|nr:MAG: 5-(carboxyamino)imidazole ribonucleotide synthase [Planctomycetota bacterium]